MNHERFIEMLNLYIDRELSGAEVHEIEEAIAQSPERQKIYAQYCRIERATQHLLAKTEAPLPSIPNLIAASRAENGPIEFDSTAPASRGRWLGWGTSLASVAAACVAVVLVLQKPGTAGNSGSTAPSSAATFAKTVLPAVDNSTYQTVFVLDHGHRNGQWGTVRSPGDSFAWMNQLNFAPIERTEIDSWQMESSNPIEVQSLNPRWISPLGLDDTPRREAMTAFQFQR